MFVPLPFAGYLSLVLAFVGVVAWVFRALGCRSSSRAPVVLVLPRALDLEITTQPDQSIRLLLARGEQQGRRSGTWEDPRVVLWAKTQAIEAKYLDPWDGVDYYVLYKEGVRQPDPNYLERFEAFEAFVATHYELDMELGIHAGYRRRAAEPRP